jgi:hypothetical protein
VNLFWIAEGLVIRINAANEWIGDIATSMILSFGLCDESTMQRRRERSLSVESEERDTHTTSWGSTLRRPIKHETFHGKKGFHPSQERELRSPRITVDHDVNRVRVLSLDDLLSTPHFFLLA